MEWQDFWAATALLLVFEGILPFLNPAAMRRMLQVMVQMDDRTLRYSGLASMVAGVVFLYLIN